MVLAERPRVAGIRPDMVAPPTNASLPKRPVNASPTPRLTGLLHSATARRIVALLLAITILASPSMGAILTSAATATRPGAIVWAVGDIASCARLSDSKVASMIEPRRGTILTLGDHAYPRGTPDNFANCFDPVWRNLTSRTQPAPGNHEYETPDAAGYFGYFGDRARNGYYAISRGEWRIYSLNSSVIDQAQLNWLAADLTAHPMDCVLAYWHEPLFTSRIDGPSPGVKPFWDLLYAAGADVVLNGHAHSYERFAPQTPDGVLADDGIREFVAGTGGAAAGEFGATAPNSEVQQTGTWGALRLRLASGQYSWTFERAAGSAFTDSGTASCH